MRLDASARAGEPRETGWQPARRLPVRVPAAAGGQAPTVMRLAASARTGEPRETARQAARNCGASVTSYNPTMDPWKDAEEARTYSPLTELGRDFAELRRRRGYSQRELARICSVAQSTISRFEAGKAPWLSCGQLAKMLMILGVIKTEGQRRRPILESRPFDWLRWPDGRPDDTFDL
jgi:DNA-binding XRE family transcriptional regulator